MQQSEQPQLRISPEQISNSPTVECECGSKMFEEGMLFKKLSPLISPTGREEVFPIQIIVCKKCGKVPAIFDREGIVPDDLKTSKTINLV
jgi:hypothetical protein